MLDGKFVSCSRRGKGLARATKGKLGLSKVGVRFDCGTSEPKDKKEGGEQTGRRNEFKRLETIIDHRFVHIHP